jgi:hypothetical protein
MTSFSLLIVVAVVIAAVALMGFRSRGTRPVARTGLMAAARIVIGLLAILLAYMALKR